jgi:hypothetical protein
MISALCTALQVLGLLITVLRLGYRVRIRLFWVEDMWVVAALICVVVSAGSFTCEILQVSRTLKAALTSAWTYAYTGGHKSVDSIYWCGLIYIPEKMASCQSLLSGCTLLPFHQPSGVYLPASISRCRLNDKIRAVRQSILFSLARIFWGTRSLRLLAYTISLIFLVFYGALVSQKAWQYGHNLNWYSHPNTNGKVNAYLTRPMIIFELISETSILNQIMTIDDLLTADCIADAILISLSLRLLWGMKLPAGKRMMILAAFSSSVFVTLISILRATFQIMRFRSILRIATDLEV